MPLPTPVASDAAANGKLADVVASEQPWEDDSVRAADILKMATETADRYLNEAKTQANQMVADAKTSSDRMLSEARTTCEQLVAEAERRADLVIEDARTRADATEREVRAMVAALIDLRSSLESPLPDLDN